MANDRCCSSETPLACDLDAIAGGDRPRYNELRAMVGAAVAGKRELPDGVALQISTSASRSRSSRSGFRSSASAACSSNSDSTLRQSPDPCGSA